jgi:SAM-dependent methyltransferase
MPNAAVFDRSVICRQEHFESGYFTYWAAQMAHAPVYHRKVWEFVYIAQALYERGLLREGAKGLGFGVGREPLTALFASRGCKIMATDAHGEHAADSGWTETAQHAASLDGLRRPQICDDARFTQSVQFTPFDMNDTPGPFRDFDFCWSACALEHLGSIEKGLDFIRNSLACLRPGGIAVHTTEFNLGYTDGTIDHAATVLFRRQDFEKLFDRLRAEGHLCAALDLTEGNQPIERYIDLPPYRSHPHLKLALEGIPTTSIGLVVHRRAD